MRETTKINPTMARLDRDAADLGVALRSPSPAQREFDLPGGRVIRYKSGGKGVLRVFAYVNGELDSEFVTSIERVRSVLKKAA